MSDASSAIGSLDKTHWAATKPAERLAILKQIQRNLCEYQDAIGENHANMKNSHLGGEKLFNSHESKLPTIVPMANHIAVAIDLYTALAAGKEFKPTGEITKVAGTDADLYDIPVAPITTKEKILCGKRSDRLRVHGTPIQKGPYDKEPKLVANLAAGNYASAIEIIKAVFFDGYVVATKPHPLNEDCDLIWAKVFAPLVQAKALAFCSSDQGPAMTKDPRVDKIYFTGGVKTAKRIMQETQTPIVCESGGVGPVVVVPGDREWTSSELAHHAQQIVSGSKLNGGAICARPQVVVTCKNWAQRDAFLEQLELAASQTTFAVGSYYPGATERMEEFAKACPTAKRIQPENGAYKNADFLLVTDDTETSYCVQHEAFSQVLTEVPLDTPSNDAAAFLDAAVDFCNTKVLGTLVAGITIDETTRKNNEEALQRAITNLQYGVVGVNLLPLHAFLSPYLTWGGHDNEEDELVTGRGHFGNVFGYENTEKSIIEDDFVSPGQVTFTNKASHNSLTSALARYYTWPSWWNLVRLLSTIIPGSFKRKDW